MGRLFFVIFLALGLWGITNSTATAQMGLPSAASSDPSTTALPNPLTPEAVREMVSQMSDAEVRRLLLERLDAVARANDTEEASGGIADFAQKATLGVLSSVTLAVTKLPVLFDTMSLSLSNFVTNLGEDGIVFLFTAFGLALATGLVAERLFLLLTRRWREQKHVEVDEPDWRNTLGFLLRRLSTDVVGLVIFFFAASTIGPRIGFQLAPLMLGTPQQTVPLVGQYISGIWVGLILLPRLAGAAGRFFFAPNHPENRILNMDDESAKRIHFHQIGLMFVVGFTVWIFHFNELNGVDMGIARIGFWLNLAIHTYMIYIAWSLRETFTSAMRGADPDVTPTEIRASEIYPFFIIGVAIGSWWLVEVLSAYGMWDLLANAPQVSTLMLLTYAPVMDTIVRSIVRHLTPPMRGEGVVAEQAYRATKRSYIRIGRILVFALVLFTIAKIWGLEFENLAAAGVGAQFAARFFEIMIILTFGYLAWELVSLWINRKLAAEQTALAFDLSEDEPGGGEGGGAGGSRLSTVLPLLLGFLKAAIATIVALIALGNIGIDITPLLAGAGVVGLAVGFGAQKLVADVVSGIFFLVDDAFRTGEYIEVEGTVGTVEKISIRSMQLRHHKGPVHTLPYGEIPKITNYSRDWVIMKLKFTVPFETDPNKVKKIFKKIGAEMMAVPEFAADMLQPFKSQGVFDFDDVGMIIRGKFMAKPGKQFTLRKEIYNRVQAEFAANGIDFARREVRVAIPSLEGTTRLTEDDKAAIAAAASQAAQAQLEASGGKPK